MNGTKVYLPQLPDCTFHLELGVHRPALFDAHIRGRKYWAYLCDPCFEEHGMGLGEGRGQRLEVTND